jgi:phytoene/squalene synthetase
MSTEQIEQRAERLRVALIVLDAAEDFAAGRYPEAAPLLPRHDLALAWTVSPADRALAQACLDAERDMRRREWEGLESLLAALPPGGNLASINDLPADQALPALHAANACRWLREAGG